MIVNKVMKALDACMISGYGYARLLVQAGQESFLQFSFARRPSLDTASLPQYAFFSHSNDYANAPMMDMPMAGDYVS